MKINFLVAFFFTVLLIGFPACTKKRIIYRSSGLHLLNFKSEEQPGHLTTNVTITWSDDDTTSTSYKTQLYLADTANTLLHDTTIFTKTITYPNLQHNTDYRHKIFSIPANDSLEILFLIGTMGDVDIKSVR